MFRVLAVGLTLIMVLWAGVAAAFLSVFAGRYQYISASELNKRLQAGDAVVLVDICPADEFAAGHIYGPIETNAFSVQTHEERVRLDRAMEAIVVSTDDVIVICPRGGGGGEARGGPLQVQGCWPEKDFYPGKRITSLAV